MHRPILACAFLALAATAVYAQQPQQTAPDPYQGQSNPPADDTITTAPPEQMKPPAGKPMVAPPAAVAAPVNRTPAPAADADNGIVQVAPDADTPRLRTRAEAGDPDGDIVHPDGDSPDALPPGTMIRARLLTLLSTTDSRRGDEFRARIASDVLQNGNVLIPTGSEIEGRVVEVSSGTTGGHGSMRLRPDFVTLPDGSRFRLDAQVVGTPGTNAKVNGEGIINGGSRYKKDGLEYGGAVGTGAVTGAVVAGPVGALTGGLIGAGAITVHLLTAHPQAVLPTGTVLLFSLNSQLNLVAADAHTTASAQN